MNRLPDALRQEVEKIAERVATSKGDKNSPPLTWARRHYNTALHAATEAATYIADFAVKYERNRSMELVCDRCGHGVESPGCIRNPGGDMEHRNVALWITRAEFERRHWKEGR